MTLGSPARDSKTSWPVLLLLGISIFINFFDRGNLSIAAPLVKDELHLSATQLGLLLSSFLWAYTVCQIPVGMLIDRFNVNRMLGGAFVLWCAATAFTGLVHGFIALLLTRLLLGAAESCAYPAYGKIFARHFEEQERGLANAVISIGQASGVAFASLIGGFIVSRFGWRSFFVIVGVCALPWLLWWIRSAPEDKSDLSQTHHVEETLEILKQRSAWATGLGFSFANYVLYFLITWLPFYLTRDRHFALSVTGEISAAVFVVKAAGSLLSGRLSDRWIISGASPNLVRKMLLCIALAAGGALLVFASVLPTRSCVVTLLLASAVFGLGTPHYYAAVQSLAGPQRAGRWTSLLMLVGSFGSILAPILTGIVVQRTGSFVSAFVIAAAFAWAGALCWLFLVGPIKPIAWVSRRVAIQTAG